MYIFCLDNGEGFRFLSLIGTNTIAQGDTREGSLDVIIRNHGSINFAIRQVKWPGHAAVVVSLLSIFKGEWERSFYLNNQIVNQITSYLDDAEFALKPQIIMLNCGKSFTGSKVYGEGFILQPEEAKALIDNNINNKDVIFPYLNGEDFNTSPTQSPSRYAINFYDWPLWKEYDNHDNPKGPPYASDYHDCIERVEKLVKPERQKILNDKSAKEKWWLYQRARNELYQTIETIGRILVCAMASKYVSFAYCQKGTIFMQMLCLFALDKFSQFSVISSSLHNEWAWKYSSTLGSGTITYSLSDCFQTFPFCENISCETELALENIGEKYHEYRKQLMLKIRLGLTKTYNQFHNKQLSIISDEFSEKEIEKKYGKETLNLWKHLSRTANTDPFKTGNTCSFNEAVEGIFQLRRLHKEMDEAVLKAYGWMDIDLAHDFYEVDYLPENDRIRYTISPAARREILKRLLELNHEIHAQEMEAEKQSTPAPKKSRGKKKSTNDKQSSIF